MLILDSLDSLLAHFQEVQQDVSALSGESLLKMSSYIEKNNLEIDDDISSALQYQDIITQQLTATIEAIQSMREDITIYVKTEEDTQDSRQKSIEKLQEKLNITLAEAKDKKNRFSGQTLANEVCDEIEFF